MAVLFIGMADGRAQSPYLLCVGQCLAKAALPCIHESHMGPALPLIHAAANEGAQFDQFRSFGQRGLVIADAVVENSFVSGC